LIPTDSSSELERGARRVGLVLGAGGMVGLAYHSGVLRALEAESPIRVSDIDVIVGTSAGSVAAAYLRSGHSVNELSQLALGTHPALADLGSTPAERRAATAFTPTFNTPGQFAGRMIGSGFVAARSFARFPTPRLPDILHPLLDAGLFTMERARERFEADLSTLWPTKATAICAVDLSSGSRTIFGPTTSPVSLADATIASCSIPGFYTPLKAGGHTYVDGGVHSPTNLDVAARLGCDLIIGIAPMAYDPSADIPAWMRLARRIGHSALRHESASARARGAEVLLIRPGADDVQVQGLNFMRATGGDRIAQTAYESTCRLLRTDAFSLALVEQP
jgi:NTE family protein